MMSVSSERCAYFDGGAYPDGERDFLLDEREGEAVREESFRLELVVVVGSSAGAVEPLRRLLRVEDGVGDGEGVVDSSLMESLGEKAYSARASLPLKLGSAVEELPAVSSSLISPSLAPSMLELEIAS